MKLIFHDDIIKSIRAMWKSNPHIISFFFEAGRFSDRRKPKKEKKEMCQNLKNLSRIEFSFVALILKKKSWSIIAESIQIKNAPNFHNDRSQVEFFLIRIWKDLNQIVQCKKKQKKRISRF